MSKVLINHYWSETENAENRFKSSLVDENLLDLKELQKGKSASYFIRGPIEKYADQREITLGGIDLAYLTRDMLVLSRDKNSNNIPYFLIDQAPKIFNGDYDAIAMSINQLIDRNIEYHEMVLSNDIEDPLDCFYEPIIYPRNTFKLVDDDTLHLSDELMSYYIELGNLDDIITSNNPILFGSLSRIVMGLMKLNSFKFEVVKEVSGNDMITPISDSFGSYYDQDTNLSATSCFLRILRWFYKKITNDKLKFSLPYAAPTATNSINIDGQIISVNRRVTFKEFLLLTLPALRILTNSNSTSSETSVVPYWMGNPFSDLAGNYDQNLVKFQFTKSMLDLRQNRFLFSGINSYFIHNLMANETEISGYSNIGATPTTLDGIENLNPFKLVQCTQKMRLTGAIDSYILYPHDYNLVTRFSKPSRIIREFDYEVYNVPYDYKEETNYIMEFPTDNSGLDYLVPIYYVNQYHPFMINDAIAFAKSVESNVSVASVANSNYELEIDRFIKDDIIFVESPTKEVNHIIIDSSEVRLGLDSEGFSIKSLEGHELFYSALSHLDALVSDSIIRNHNFYNLIVDKVVPTKGYSPTLLSYSLDSLQSKVADKATTRLAVIDSLLEVITSSVDDIFVNDLSTEPDSLIYYITRNSFDQVLPDTNEFICIRVNRKDVNMYREVLETNLNTGAITVPYVFTSESMGGNLFIQLQGNSYSDGLIAINADNGKFYCREDNKWAQVNQGTIITVSLKPGYKLNLNLYSPSVEIDGKYYDDLNPSFINNSSSKRNVDIVFISNTYITNLNISDVTENIMTAIFDTVCTDDDQPSTNYLINYADGLVDNVASINECSLIDQLSILVEDYVKTVGEENLSISDVNSIVDSVIQSSESEFAKLKDQLGDSGIFLKKLVSSNLNNCRVVASKIKDSLINAKVTTGNFIQACGARVANLNARIQGGITGCSDLFGSLLGVNNVNDDGLGWSDSSNYSRSSSLGLALSCSYDLSGVLRVGQCLGKLIDNGITWVYNKCTDFISETFVDGVSYKVNSSGFECIDIPAYQKVMTIDQLYDYNPFMHQRFVNLINNGMDKFSLVTQVNTVLCFYQYANNQCFVSFSPILYDYDVTKEKDDYNLLQAIVKSRIKVISDYNLLIDTLKSINDQLSREFYYIVSVDSGMKLSVPDANDLYKLVMKGATVSYTEKTTTNVKKYCATAAAIAGVCLLIPGVRWFAAAALAVTAVVALFSEVVEETLTTEKIDKVMEKAATDSSYANTNIETYELLSLNTGYDTRVFDLYNKIINSLGRNNLVHCGDGNLSLEGNYLPLAEFISTPTFKFHLLTDDERTKATRLRLLIIGAAITACALSAFKVTRGLRLSAKKNKLTAKLYTAAAPNPDDMKYLDSSNDYLKDVETYKRGVAKTVRKLARVEKKLGQTPGATASLLSILMSTDTGKQVKESISSSVSEQSSSVISNIIATSNLINNNHSNSLEAYNNSTKSINDNLINNQNAMNSTITQLEARLNAILSRLELSSIESINKISKVNSDLQSTNDDVKAELTNVLNSLSLMITSLDNNVLLTDNKLVELKGIIDQLDAITTNISSKQDTQSSIISGLKDTAESIKITSSNIQEHQTKQADIIKDLENLAIGISNTQKEQLGSLDVINDKIDRNKQDLESVGDSVINRSDIVEV